MTDREQTENIPLTISVRDFARREAEAEIDALNLPDTKVIKTRIESAYERIRDRIGKQIMIGSLRAYAFNDGSPVPIDIGAERKHPLIVELAAWLDGRRYGPSQPDRRFPPEINRNWIQGIHVEDVDIATELEAAKARIAELEAELASLETGGIQVEGKEAPELDAAIALYRAVANSAALPAGLTPAKALLQKAEELFPDMPPEAQKRLATVCNWEKERGRRKK